MGRLEQLARRFGGPISGPMAISNLAESRGVPGLNYLAEISGLNEGIDRARRHAFNPLSGELFKSSKQSKKEKARAAERDYYLNNPERSARAKASYDDWQSFANAYQADAMQGANAIGQMMGQSLNRRGLGGSPLGAGLQSQAMTQALGRANSELGKMRLGYMQNQAQLGLQDRQLGLQERRLENQEQAESNQMLLALATMVGKIGGTDWAKENIWDKLGGDSLGDLDTLAAGTDVGSSGIGMADMASPAPVLAPMPDFSDAPDRADIVTRNQLSGVADRLQELTQGREEGWDSPAATTAWEGAKASRLDSTAQEAIPAHDWSVWQQFADRTPEVSDIPMPDAIARLTEQGVPAPSVGTRPVAATNLDAFGQPKKRLPSGGYRNVPGAELEQLLTPSRVAPLPTGPPVLDVAEPEVMSQIRQEAESQPTIRDQERYTDNPNFSRSTDKRVREYDAIIEAKAEKYNLPADLLRAVIYVESGGESDALSPAGAVGLMQLMEGTASDMKVKNRYSAEENVEGGAKYLAKMLKRYDNDLEQALAAYNMGPTALDSGREWPRETRKYLPKVINLYLRYQKGS